MIYRSEFVFANRRVSTPDGTLCGAAKYARHVLATWKTVKSIEVSVSAPFIGKDVLIGTMQRKEGK